MGSAASVGYVCFQEVLVESCSSQQSAKEKARKAALHVIQDSLTTQFFSYWKCRMQKQNETKTLNVSTHIKYFSTLPDTGAGKHLKCCQQPMTWHTRQNACAKSIACMFCAASSLSSTAFGPFSALGEDAERRKATQIFAAYAVARLLHSVQGPEPEVLDPDSVAVLQ